MRANIPLVIRYEAEANVQAQEEKMTTITGKRL
jgi:hypothetical protein